ncbi:hypothetical protein R1flu_023779 [Riccia fluitans]|uniref:Uncharacterized protein n=1 Tax=Riccia fluitans TaxID=41844 RepID=A0ABD1XT60_9MARC
METVAPNTKRKEIAEQALAYLELIRQSLEKEEAHRELNRLRLETRRDAMSEDDEALLSNSVENANEEELTSNEVGIGEGTASEDTREMQEVLDRLGFMKT